MDGYEQQAELFKVLAHPIRLHILDILKEGECCVCHLTTVLQQRQPYVSQQLMALRDAGLVVDRKEGTLVYYRLADDRVAEFLALARQSLRAMGLTVEVSAIPKPPINGCPCPKCQELSACCSILEGTARRVD